MIEITANRNVDRLDVFIAEILNITRSRATALIKKQHVMSDSAHKILKPSSSVFEGDVFHVEIPLSNNLGAIIPENIDFDVVYEDMNILVINKPSGLVVHPAPGNREHTLVNAILFRYPDVRLISQRSRPGIVHRLDAGTSGLMVVARTDEAMVSLQKMFGEHKVNKQYIALIHGRPERSEGIISAPIDRDPDNATKRCVIEGGRPAMTGYKVLWTRNRKTDSKKVSMVLCKLFTGRTHQIRVHFSALNCPLIGDISYGAGDEGLKRVYLHSWKLEFPHPITNIPMKFIQHIGADFTEYIKNYVI